MRSLQVEESLIGAMNPNQMFWVYEQGQRFHVFLDSPSNHPQNCSCLEWRHHNGHGKPDVLCRHIVACQEFNPDNQNPNDLEYAKCYHRMMYNLCVKCGDNNQTVVNGIIQCHNCNEPKTMLSPK